jgi:tRNA (guanine-N7-)-methyltransferase
MLQPVLVAHPDGDLGLPQLGAPLDLEALVPGAGEWEVEIGFGKGRYLLQRAREDEGRRFLGIEVASKYCRLLVRRGRRRQLANLLAFRAEAVYLMAAVLPRAFASAVHIYFPDPWPKTRHRKRRLLDAESVDLLLGLLRPGGRLFFATDFLEYGERVRELLEAHPQLRVDVVEGLWPEGPRTNYEAKYVREGRPILRLVATLTEQAPAPHLHPAGAAGILVALARKTDEQAIQEGALEASLSP